VIPAIILGSALSICNAFIGFMFIKYAYRKKIEKFNSIVFTSMTIRYFVVACIVFVILKYSSTNQLGFAISFMISTFIVTFLEIFFLNSRLNFLISLDDFDK